MGRTLDKGVLVGVGLVVALLVGNAALAYRNTRQLLEDAGWVAHTREVLDLTSDLLRTLVDAETGQRGFLITGKEDFLEPYRQALARLDQQVRALKDKTQDNPRQQARIGELETLSTSACSRFQSRTSSLPTPTMSSVLNSRTVRLNTTRSPRIKTTGTRGSLRLLSRSPRERLKSLIFIIKLLRVQ